MGGDQRRCSRDSFGRAAGEFRVYHPHQENDALNPRDRLASSTSARAMTARRGSGDLGH